MIHARSVVVMFAVLGGCSKGKDGAEAPAAVPATAPAAKATPASGPSRVVAPPPGVVVPAIMASSHAEAGTAGSWWTWRAVVEMDPTRPEVVKALAALRASRANGAAADAGDAGVELYLEQVRATGINPNLGLASESSFQYAIEGGLDVQVSSAPELGPNKLEIAVGPAGG